MAARRSSRTSICRARWAGSPACSRSASIRVRSISTRPWRAGPALGRALKTIKEQLRALPDNGLGYGLLRYLNPQTASQLAGLATPQIGFNYLGRFAAPAAETGLRLPRAGRLAAAAIPAMPLAHALEVNALTLDDPAGATLSVTWSWGANLLTAEAVRDLAQRWFVALGALVRHVAQPGAGGRTPSDLPLVALSQAEIEQLESKYSPLEDILPLSPLQEGLLFHALYDAQGPDVYTVQLEFELEGLLDESVLKGPSIPLYNVMPACVPASSTRTSAGLCRSSCLQHRLLGATSICRRLMSQLARSAWRRSWLKTARGASISPLRRCCAAC